MEIKVLLKQALTDQVNDREMCMKGIDASYAYPSDADAIHAVTTGTAQKSGAYTLTGVKVGNDAQGLPAGLYIINGKKVVVR